MGHLTCQVELFPAVPFPHSTMQLLERRRHTLPEHIIIIITCDYILHYIMISDSLNTLVLGWHLYRPYSCDN